MALRLKELNPGVDYEYVITPTGDELPDMAEHWRKMETLLGRSLTVLPNQTLRELIEEYQTLPNHLMRFCTRVIKIEPMLDYLETLDAGSVLYVGLRADEEDRLGLRYPEAPFTVSLPMQEWGWTLGDVQSYLAAKEITIPARTDCARCFFQSIEDWRQLWLKHPEIYQSAVDDEERIGHTYRGPKKDKNWPHKLTDLRAEFASGRKPRVVKRGRRCRFCTM